VRFHPLCELKADGASGPSVARLGSPLGGNLEKPGV
jgi:hypothetical protein